MRDWSAGCYRACRLVGDVGSASYVMTLCAVRCRMQVTTSTLMIGATKSKFIGRDNLVGAPMSRVGHAPLGLIRALTPVQRKCNASRHDYGPVTLRFKGTRPLSESMM